MSQETLKCPKCGSDNTTLLDNSKSDYWNGNVLVCLACGTNSELRENKKKQE